MIQFFNQQWDTVPLVVVDTETTGPRPGRDKTVSFGLSRFENGKFVASYEQIVDPGIVIPDETIAIHGITNEMVAGQPTLEQAWNEPRVQELLVDAQPSAFNYTFDERFVPGFCEPWDWPWVDALTFIRKIDKFVPGKGRHKLSACCERHGVQLLRAHSAGADSRAAGELLYVIGRKALPLVYTMGQLLGWQMRINAAEWERFHKYKASLPPLDV